MTATPHGLTGALEIRRSCGSDYLTRQFSTVTADSASSLHHSGLLCITGMDRPDTSYDNDRGLLTSPVPSMRRGILPSSGPRPQRQSLVLHVEPTTAGLSEVLPASQGITFDQRHPDEEALTPTTTAATRKRPDRVPQWHWYYGRNLTHICE